MKKRLLGGLLMIAMLVALVPVMTAPSVATAEATSTNTSDYNDLYVQDGLIGLFDAYDSTDTTKVDLTSGKWYNQVDGGATFATIEQSADVTAPKWWAGQDGVGIGYDQTVAQWYDYRNVTGIDMSTAFSMPTASYTFEIVTEARGFSANGVRTTGTPFEVQTAETGVVHPADGKTTYYIDWPLTWGLDKDKSPVIGLGPLKGMPFRLGNTMTSEPFKYVSPDSLVFDFIYQANSGGAPAYWGSWGAAYSFGFHNAIDDTDVEVTSFAVAHNFVSTTNYSFIFYTNTASSFTNSQNGVEGFSYSGTKTNYQPNTRYQTYQASTNGTFEMMYGFANTTYAIRMYDRTLTAAEMKHNHVVDLLAYHGIDRSAYAPLMTASAFGHVIGKLSAYTFETEKTTIVAELDGLMASYQSRDDINNYYVQEGLVLLLDGFDNTNTAKLDLASGKWYNQVLGSTSYATIKKATGEGAPTWWLNDGAGFGYDLTTAQWESASNFRLNMGINLATAATLPTHDYTAEYVMQARGFSANGQRTTGTPFNLQASGTYANYPVSFGADPTRQAFIGLGPIKAVPFRLCNTTSTPTDHINADSLLFDFLYQPNNNGTPAYWGSYGAAYTNVFTNAVSGSDVNITPFTVTHDYVSNAEYHYRFYHNGATGFTGASGQNGVEGFSSNLAKSNYQPARGDGYNSYKASTHGTFEVMSGFAGTMYAVRVYDRVLSADEMKHNHAIDLMAYNDLTADAYRELLENPEIFAKCVAEMGSFTFETDGATVKAVADKYNSLATAITYEGLQAKIAGGPGVRSLYAIDWNAINALSADYTVTFGAIMGIGSVGNVHYNTTDGLEVSGNVTDGYIANNSNAKAVVVYSSADAAYASESYIDAEKTGFAYTTTYDATTMTKAYYQIGLVYAGFVVITDSEGNGFVHYIPATGGLFGAINATYGTTTTAQEVAIYFRENGYESNAILQSIIDICNS